MKVCNKCGEGKEESCFCKEPRNRDGLSGECKACKRIRSKKWREQNPDYFSQYYKENEDHLSSRRKTYYENNKEYELELNKRWRDCNYQKLYETRRLYQLNNPHILRFSKAKRRAVLIYATPCWLTEDDYGDIKEIYETCPYGYEVDHIIPLQGKGVCGLHVPSNLQHLEASENRKKSNLFEPIWMTKAEALEVMKE